MLNFVVVATLLFCFFCVCPKFCDLAKQRREILWGVSEVRKKRFFSLFSKKKCFSNALGYTLVVSEVL